MLDILPFPFRWHILKKQNKKRQSIQQDRYYNFLLQKTTKHKSSKSKNLTAEMNAMMEDKSINLLILW